MAVIPESLWGEIYDRSLLNQPYRSIRDWLLTAHGVKVSHVAVINCCRREEARRAEAAAKAAEKAAREAVGREPDDHKSAMLRVLQGRVRREVKRSAKVADLDWKRYHSALRLAIQIDGALIRRVEFEERPVLVAPKGAGLPAEEEAASAMSQEERDRMVQEAAVN